MVQGTGYIVNWSPTDFTAVDLYMDLSWDIMEIVIAFLAAPLSLWEKNETYTWEIKCFWVWKVLVL